MGLETSTGRATFVNIKEGRLYTKEKEQEPQFFDSISGVITKVVFKDAEYQGKPYEKLEISILDGEDKFILSMRVDSGYFRGFVNSLKTGDPTKRMKITPNSKTVNDKPQTTCFVEQVGKPLKHAHTKENPGNLPQVESVIFKGQQMWDSTAQTKYWKDWLLSLPFQHEAIAGATQFKAEPQKQTAAPQTVNSDIPQEDDGLPF